MRSLLAVCLLFGCLPASINAAENLRNPESATGQAGIEVAEEQGMRPSAATLETQAPQDSSSVSEDRANQQLPFDATRISLADFNEQRRMADAADGMALDSVKQTRLIEVATVVNIVGLAILIVALIFNGQATNAATRAADASMLAARNNRAWVTMVSPEKMKLEPMPDGDFELIFRWKNGGATPAINVTMTLCTTFIPRQTHNAQIAPIPISEYRWPATVGVLGPDEATSGKILIPQNFAELLTTSQEDLIQAFRVTYSTVYDGVHGFTTYGFRLAFNPERQDWVAHTLGQCCTIDTEK